MSETDTSTTRLVVWADPGQEPLIRAVLAAGDLRLAGVGAPDHAQAQALAANLDAPSAPDVREAAVREQADLVWLAADAPIEPAFLTQLRAGGVQVVSSEPQPGGIADLAAAGTNVDATLLALMRHGPCLGAMLDALDQFGTRHCVTLSMRAGAGQGSILARLFDATDLLERLCGTPRSVDASFVGSDGLLDVGETLRHLRGHMTLNLRYGGDRCGAISVSNAAGRWFRGGTILGEGGCIRFSDDGFDWIAPDGSVVETHRVDHADESSGRAPSIFARALQAAARGADRLGPPADPLRTLAVCEASRLSCRTGEGETPGRFVEMFQRM